MQVGKLDQRITFETLVENNVNGSLQQTWAGTSPPDTVWAEVLPPRGQEAFESARINEKKTIRVRVRYRDDILNTWRFTWEGEIYFITTVDRSERRKGNLWLMAQLNGAT